MAGTEGTVIACHTKEEFEAQLDKASKAKKLVVVDFMKPLCPPCQAMAPVFADCAKDYPTAAVFLKVDVSQLEVKEVAAAYCVEWVPTFVFIDDDGPVETFVGARPDKLRKTIEELIGGDGTLLSRSASSSSSARLIK